MSKTYNLTQGTIPQIQSEHPNYTNIRPPSQPLNKSHPI